jgi:signal transduction histidine kinase
MQRHLLQAQKLEAIGSLAGGIAHEINTPMQYVGDNVRFLGESIASMIGAVQAARALADLSRTQSNMASAVAAFDLALGELDMTYLMAELPLAAAHSREGCDRVGDIVKAMKGFSHPGRSEKQLVDLNAAVREVIIVCRSEWKYVATMDTNFEAAMPMVPCLPGELQQVVLNLIVNAAHAVAEARGDSGQLGAIAVSTRLDGGWAEIRVQDDGAGIPESIRAQVFDPFFTTKKAGSGTGQGLSIAHTTIVRKHEGTLTFESTTGHGTTFLIRLPVDGGISVGEAA